MRLIDADAMKDTNNNVIAVIDPETKSKYWISNQWQLNGDCQLCRRQKYCSKPCKKHRVRVESEIHNLILEKTGLGQIFDAICK